MKKRLLLFVVPLYLLIGCGSSKNETETQRSTFAEATSEEIEQMTPMGDEVNIVDVTDILEKSEAIALLETKAEDFSLNLTFPKSTDFSVIRDTISGYINVTVTAINSKGKNDMVTMWCTIDGEDANMWRVHYMDHKGGVLIDDGTVPD